MKFGLSHMDEVNQLGGLDLPTDGQLMRERCALALSVGGVLFFRLARRLIGDKTMDIILDRFVQQWILAE